MDRLLKLFARRNRGLLLDACVFIFQLFLLRALTILALSFVQQARVSAFAKTTISLFLLGLFILQPLGPVLKRWSFHQHYQTFENDATALSELLLTAYKLFYIVAMSLMIYVSFLYFADAFPETHSQRVEDILVAAAILLPIICGFIIFRYFRKPGKPPRWKFLMSPQAEALGDLCMFLNLICFQMLFSVYVSSPHFWNALHKTTRLAAAWNSLSSGAPLSSLLVWPLANIRPPSLAFSQVAIGSISSVSGRLYIALIVALIVYLPPRIFYLVIDQHRKITWLMMLLANLPLILSIVFYAPAPQLPKAPREPSFKVAAADLHREYLTDFQTGMKKFRGQVVNVTGRVQTRFFPRSLELEDEIGLDGEKGYPWVYCSFDEDQVETAEVLELGQLVTLQCEGSDDWSRGPAMKHCIVVSVQK